MNMIPEIKLMYLRDIAFEYLPAAQDKMLANAKFISYRGSEYWYQLHHAATLQCNRNMPATELASVYLLHAIAGYGIGRSVSFVDDELNEDELNGEDLEIYNSITPQERQDWAVDSIARAVEELCEVTGRAIMFDPVETVGIDSARVAKPRKKLKPQDRDVNEGLQLLYEMFTHYKVEYLDDLPASRAWGKIVSGEFTSDLIISISDAKKSIILNGGDKLSKTDFSDKYRRRFIVK